jgi:hypothetical protein
MQTMAELLEQSWVIRNPPGNEPGYWAGAPGLFYHAQEEAFYLTYRLRRPRGVAPERGGEARIARSRDLQNFEDIWRVTKNAFGAPSIERSALRYGPDGLWRYFTSYVDPEDGRWCVAVLEAEKIEQLDPKKCRRVFSAKPLNLEGIKDPWIHQENGRFFMIISVALPTSSTSESSHATLDIYNTGECLSATGLATSNDLKRWEWQGVIFAPEQRGWDGYCRRINSFLEHDGKYLGFYDGSAGRQENYEEKTGLCVSSNLKQWQTLTPHGPALTSPGGSGSLRYLEAQRLQDRLLLLFEQARNDGAHELRLLELPWETALNQFIKPTLTPAGI